MQIKIIDNNRAQSYTEQCTFVWKWYKQKYFRLILYSFIIGIFLILADLNIYKNPKLITGIATHLMESIGIMFLFFGCIYIVQFIKLKKRFFQRMKSAVDRYAQDANIAYINIDTASVGQQTHFSKIEYTWEAVTGYYLKNHLIFLFTSDTIESAIMIDKCLLSATEYTELTTFLHSRIPLKKELI
jgi:hypothetical protein